MAVDFSDIYFPEQETDFLDISPQNDSCFVCLEEFIHDVKEAIRQEAVSRVSELDQVRPVSLLDSTWNFILSTSVIVILILGRNEQFSTLKLWMIGYGVQCAFYALCAAIELVQRIIQVNSSHGSIYSFRNDAYSFNLLLSLPWFIFGLWCVSSSFDGKFSQSTILLWSCATFLCLDVIFVMFLSRVGIILMYAIPYLLVVILCLPANGVIYLAEKLLKGDDKGDDKEGDDEGDNKGIDKGVDASSISEE